MLVLQYNLNYILIINFAMKCTVYKEKRMPKFVLHSYCNKTHENAIFISTKSSTKILHISITLLFNGLKCQIFFFNVEIILHIISDTSKQYYIH